MKYKEIITNLSNYYQDVNEFAYIQSGEVPGLGKFEEIDQYGGEEKGVEWYAVKYFKDIDIYIKVEGHYYSYDGTYFDSWEDSCSQVTPQEKTIIVYE